MLAVERSGEFHGLYHVLGGALSPMDGVGPDELRIRELEARVAEGEIHEVVIATDPDVEGEATAYYVAERLARLWRSLFPAPRMACRPVPTSSTPTSSPWLARSRDAARSDSAPAWDRWGRDLANCARESLASGGRITSGPIAR